ncbi:hypothetical protein D3C75_1356230 [compost metagenome]
MQLNTRNAEFSQSCHGLASGASGSVRGSQSTIWERAIKAIRKRKNNELTTARNRRRPVFAIRLLSAPSA